jgi:putative ABC transport system permease protein
MGNLQQDIRYAFRMLLKNPGFTTMAVLTLALGIAANATIFSLVSAVLFRRPPVADPGRVVMAVSTNPAVGWNDGLNPSSAATFVDWREHNQVFKDMAAGDSYGTASLTGHGDPERVGAMHVSAGYFSVLGVPALLGRTFNRGEDQAGHDHVVILSHDLWQQRFGADPKLIGKTVGLNGEPYTVIGVMPASFRLQSFPAQLWTPLVLSAAQLTPASRDNRFLYVFARLKPGVTVEQAQTQIATLARRAQDDFPATEKNWDAGVFTLQDYVIRQFNIRPALVMLMAAVAFVLLIACGNIGGLLLARATSRGKEMAIRAALGAGRVRVIRQLLTESLFIALLGGGLGLLLSFWGVDLLRASLSFNEAVRSFNVVVDGYVLAYTAAVSMLAAILFGLAPSLQTSRVDLQTTLRNDSRAGSAGRSRRRLHGVLVCSEIALALVLLTGTGLLIKGIIEPMKRGLGFNPQNLRTVDIPLTGSQYQEPRKQAEFFHDVIERVRALPGGQSAAAANSLAATGAERVPFQIEGNVLLQKGEGPRTRHYVVSPQYLQTMEIPVLKGRGITAADRADSPAVVLINEVFARRFLSGQEPLGKRISLDSDDAGKPQWREIVGVVGSVVDWPLQSTQDPQVYESYLQRPAGYMNLAIRSRSEASSLTPEIRRAIWSVDKDQPVGNFASMAKLLSDEQAGDFLMTKMLGIFAFLALSLAAVGIYGMVAYAVGRRTHEIGLRMALGARRLEIFRMVLGEGMKLTLIGTLVRLALALPLPKLFESAFIDFHVHASSLFLIVPAVIAVVALLACYIPARRAMKVDPMEALRYE